MPYAIQFDGQLDALVVTTSGDLRAEEFHAMIEATRQRCAEIGSVRVLVDHSQSTVRNISAEQISGIAETCICLNEVLRAGRLAVVLAGDVDYGLGRMWESYIADKLAFHSRLFRDRAAAVMWLVDCCDDADGDRPTSS